MMVNMMMGVVLSRSGCEPTCATAIRAVTVALILARILALISLLTARRVIIHDMLNCLYGLGWWRRHRDYLRLHRRQWLWLDQINDDGLGFRLWAKR